jgi:hypothetical protein
LVWLLRSCGIDFGANHAIDLFGGNAAIVIVRGFQRVAPKVSHKVGGMFEFYPGINIEHKSTSMLFTFHLVHA